LSGTDKPTISVALDADGRLYYENQGIEEEALLGRLKEVVGKSSEPLTLVVLADKRVPHERVMRLAELASNAGIREATLAALPGPMAHPLP
jgi:biopolymer transport protein ExbD